MSLTWVVEQLEFVNELTELEHTKKGIEVWLPIVGAKNGLKSLMSESAYVPYLRVSFEKANSLYKVLLSFVPAEGELMEELSLSKADIWNIKYHLQQFETVFRAELATIPIFLITRKGPYDLDSLIEKGDDLFPQHLLQKVPEAEFDALEAGKCLAFERSTACGFHTFRLVEAVLRKYWDTVTNGSTRPDPQTLGKISADLDNKKCGDVKVLEALKQLAKLHRNPIAHPDVILTIEEAQAIIGMSHSVVAHMLLALPEIPMTTGAVLLPNASVEQ